MRAAEAAVERLYSLSSAKFVGRYQTVTESESVGIIEEPEIGGGVRQIALALVSKLAEWW